MILILLIWQYGYAKNTLLELMLVRNNQIPLKIVDH